jgi:hypothetical protein
MSVVSPNGNGGTITGARIFPQEWKYHTVVWGILSQRWVTEDVSPGAIASLVACGAIKTAGISVNVPHEPDAITYELAGVGRSILQRNGVITAPEPLPALGPELEPPAAPKAKRRMESYE